MAERIRPLFASLTADSTREEVLAALAEIDRRDAELAEQLASGTYEGAVTNCRFGPDVEDEIDIWERTANGDVLNKRAFDRHMDQVGQEDQSAPGWDAGP